MNKKWQAKNKNMATQISLSLCASFICLIIIPNVVLASGSSPVRQQPGGYEQVQPVFIPGSEQDISTQTSGSTHESNSIMNYHSDGDNEYINTQCHSDHICAGDRVIDESRNVGNVVEVFSNGKATIKLDDYSSEYTRKADSLGKAVKCFKGICVNNRIIDASSNTGKVVEVFDSGKARIDLDDYSSDYVRDVSDLSVSVSR